MPGALLLTIPAPANRFSTSGPTEPPDSTFSEILSELVNALWDSVAGISLGQPTAVNPPKPIVNWDEDIDYEAWNSLPFPVSFLTVGRLYLIDGVVRAELSIVDMKQQTAIPGKRFTGEANQIRRIAHRWADEVVYTLTAGASRGIASTKIAYASRIEKDVKEI